MKKLYTLLAVALCTIFAMQAQMKPNVAKINKVDLGKKEVAAKVAGVTINDIVGTYDAYGYSAFKGQPNESWTVKITRDETDPNKVWILPVFQFAGLTADYINPVYATFDAVTGNLAMPMGQVLYEDPDYTFAMAITIDGSTIDLNGSMVMSVSAEGKKIAFDSNYIIGVGNIAKNEWWFQALYDITYTKVQSDPSVYIHRKDSSVTWWQTPKIFFNEIDGVMCVTNVQNYVDDPVAGTYKTHGVSAFEGEPDENWTLQITRDYSEEGKYILHPIFPFGGLDESMIKDIYAYYDAEGGNLLIPLGQPLYTSTKYNIVLACTLDGGTTVITDTTKAVPYIVGNGTIRLQGAILGAYDTMSGYWYQALASIEMNDVQEYPIPLSEIKKISRTE